jgi:hypothetical protein
MPIFLCCFITNVASLGSKEITNELVHKQTNGKKSRKMEKLDVINVQPFKQSSNELK